MIRDATGSGGPVEALSSRAVLQSSGGEEQDMPGEAPRQAGQVDSGRNSDSGIAAPSGRQWMPRSAAPDRFEIPAQDPALDFRGFGGARRRPGACAGNAGAYALLLRHRRGDAACDVRRRDGRSTSVGDLPDPRACQDRGRECRAAQPRRRPQRRDPALRGAAQSARPARHRLEQRQAEAGTARHAAGRKRRARRARLLPGLRPLADAALGGRRWRTPLLRCAKGASPSTL